MLLWSGGISPVSDGSLHPCCPLPVGSLLPLTGFLALGMKLSCFLAPAPGPVRYQWLLLLCPPASAPQCTHPPSGYSH